MGLTPARSDGRGFSSDERIKQLIEIDNNIVKMLRSAGLAVKALTDQPLDSESEVMNEERRKKAFDAATKQYFSLLSSVDVGVRRQIWALEEADILPAEAIPKESAIAQSSSALPGSSQPKEKAAVEVGGLGSLDVGWLNSRNDKVGKDMDAELWEKMHRQLAEMEEDLKARSGNDIKMST